MRLGRYNLIFNVAAAVLSAAIVSSCIENDVPPPQIRGAFEEFEVEGQTKAAVIDTYNRTVAVDLEETVDPKKVKLTNVAFSETSVCEIGTGSVVDLSSPLKVIIKTQAEYEWTITATQTIIRRFVIENQVGESYFEEHSRSVFASVPADTDMTKINIIELKLGPEGQTTMVPNLSGVVSFRQTSEEDTAVRDVVVQYRDNEPETWSLYVTETGTGMRTVSRSDIWATFATVTATVLDADAADIRFGYRKTGATAWKYAAAVPDANYGYSAKITGLDPNTSYEVNLDIDGTFMGEPVSFTTETAAQPRNPGFEEHGYSAETGNKIGYYFYTNIADKFWDCGNAGSMTLSKNVTVPETDPRPGSAGTYSAKLESTFVVLKFAAGNMYSGDYVETVGTNGKINFGREFTSRPSSLGVWHKANSGTVNHSAGGGLEKGDTDKRRILIALTDWNGQKQIYTKEPDTFIDWDSDPGIIAYGEYVSSAPVPEWTKLTIDLKYRSLTRIPTHIVIIASASMLGDYFTGSTESWMYLDDFELVYDDNIVLGN